MSIHQCCICDLEQRFFFYWTSSRYFPKNKCINFIKDLPNKHITFKDLKEGRKVCYGCAGKLGYGVCKESV